jgi:hypothetical protein
LICVEAASWPLGLGPSVGLLNNVPHVLEDRRWIGTT